MSNCLGSGSAIKLHVPIYHYISRVPFLKPTYFEYISRSPKTTFRSQRVPRPCKTTLRSQQSTRASSRRRSGRPPDNFPVSAGRPSLLTATKSPRRRSLAVSCGYPFFILLHAQLSSFASACSCFVQDALLTSQCCRRFFLKRLIRYALIAWC